ncbi:MAG: hypothetical protein PHX38_00815 [Sulfuricella sp.]|nr:hypothetical protein [Sulfuricella sp.]
MELNLFALARALHVIGVVLWIGGVAMVTTVLLPATRKLKSGAEQVAFFEKIEQGFARQARYTTLLTGLTGFYMLGAMHAWARYHQAQYWWVPAMTAVWAIFTLMLFVLEPLVLHKWFQQKAAQNPEKTFRVIQRLHWVLLTLSLVTVFGAVSGAHGWLLPG